MAKFWSLRCSYVFSIVLVVNISIQIDANDEERKVHIVYMGSLPEGDYSSPSHHLDVLREVVDESFISQSLVRSYTRSFNAFAAYLNEQERQKLDSFDGVVSVFPSRSLQLQTTRSWDFMSFSKKVRRNPTVESNVIVGVIDSGIWPESDSFNDKGFGPPPKKWKGACNGGQNFTCNNKLIGARWYLNNYNGDAITADDIIGHGTHTASTAAGNSVANANFYGIAQGTTRGGVPSARIAVYKVCHPLFGCEEADILAAFDDAIADGVDILTVSLGREDVVDVTEDAISIGAFHAAERGILTVNSAGNNGLSTPRASIGSVAPWILTVAASNTDRRILNEVVLGDGKTLVGNAINGFQLNGSDFSLIYGKEVTRNCNEREAKLCTEGCLDPKLVREKIVVCDDLQGMDEAQRAGAVGAIVPNKGLPTDASVTVPLPATLLNDEDIALVKVYINSSKTPHANISKSESISHLPTPIVASFSSKGPNLIIPDILKPDITAPGVDILAAYSIDAFLTDSPNDLRVANYAILSGTSMSCPHVTGAAAYVKTFHPEWSPSAIKSALMTTAWPMNGTKNPDAEFGYGAGHLDPVRAAHPGLLYEIITEDYVKMLCDMGYSSTKLKKILGYNSSCRKGRRGSPTELNYPSLAALVKPASRFRLKFPRTVTNVGKANSTYKAVITKNDIFSASAINVRVNPSILSFKSISEKKSFVVTINGRGLKANESAFASLVWSDGIHNVRSPIVVYRLVTNIN